MFWKIMLGWLDSAIRRRKKALDDVTASQILAVLRCCVWLLVEMPSFRAVFGLNNRKYGVNRHLLFCPFQKNSEMCRVSVRIIHLTMGPTRHISELKYKPKHGTFPSFLEIDKTAGAYSLHIYAYLSVIQRETKAFLLIVRHNTEGPLISDWQWHNRRLFFFFESQNRVNLLFFKPWYKLQEQPDALGASCKKYITENEVQYVQSYIDC